MQIHMPIIFNLWSLLGLQVLFIFMPWLAILNIDIPISQIIEIKILLFFMSLLLTIFNLLIYSLLNQLKVLQRLCFAHVLLLDCCPLAAFIASWAVGDSCRWCFQDYWHCYLFKDFAARLAIDVWFALMFYSAWALFLTCCETLIFALAVSEAMIKFGISAWWVVCLTSSIDPHHLLIFLITRHVRLRLASTRRHCILVLCLSMLEFQIELLGLRLDVLLMQNDVSVPAHWLLMISKAFSDYFLWIVVIPQKVFAEKCMN